jgi:hypothetical protein
MRSSDDSGGPVIAVDRNLWEASIYGDHVPAWPCPKCGVPGLRIVNESFCSVENRKTGGRQFHVDDDTTWFGTGRFVCVLQCERGACGEICSVAGDFVINYVDFQEGDSLHPGCTPRVIAPGPQVIKTPKRCPDKVKAEIDASFLLHWSDHASCLNRIRNALELLLTEMKIPKTTIDKHRSRKLLNLHDRIIALERRKPGLKPLCDRMMAVKHLGNAGSHAGEKVKREDVFDGFDILERVLHDMYSTTDGELSKMVREINKRKGPRKKTRDV